MNSLKIILFIVLFVSFLGCNLSEDNNSDYLTLFTSEEDLTLLSGDKASIEIKINSDDVKKLRLLYNDSIIKTWNSPKKTNDSDSKPLRFVFDSKGLPLGSSVIRLQTEVSSEVDFLEDEKTITIWNKTAPEVKTATVIASYPHDPSSYTQGLEFFNGQLYEGTGDPGQKGESKLLQLDLKSGKSLKTVPLEKPYFGEGITILNNQIYQLTWRGKICKKYDLSSFEELGSFSYSGEGWGLCNDGKYLIMSNGSHTISFRDPKTFQTIKTIDVCTDKGFVEQLNELEYINGEIYANIYTSNLIAIIDPNTGGVRAIVNANNLEALGKGEEGDYFNGIAYNKNLFVTGKFWNKLFEIKIE